MQSFNIKEWNLFELHKQCKHSKGGVDVIMVKFNNPQMHKRWGAHIKFEYEGMNTAGVTDYTIQTSISDG